MAQEGTVGNDSTEILRLDVDGRWYPEELAAVLTSLSTLYDLRLVLESLREEMVAWEELYAELRHFPPFGRFRKRAFLLQGAWPYARPSILVEPEYLARISRLVYPEERLEIRRIEYASPGFSDFAGIGAVVGHVKDFVVHLIEHRAHRDQRVLADERAQLENERMRIENARAFLSLAREVGYTPTEMRRLVDFVDGKQEALVDVVEKQKLVGASILKDTK